MNVAIGPRRWTDRPWLALAELAILVALFAADRRGLVPLSNTPFLFVLGWISLRLRGLGWRDVGFVRPSSWLRALALGAVAGFLMELLAVFGTERSLSRSVSPLAHPP